MVLGQPLVFLALIFVALASAWTLLRVWRIAAIGSAYKAKVLCSIMFGTDRTIDPHRLEDVSVDLYAILRVFRTRVNAAERSVTVSLLGLRSRSAVFRPGRGAALISRARTPPAIDDEPRTPSIATPHTWPEAVASSKLKRVADAAFDEPNIRRVRRTRAVLVVQDGRILVERYAPGFSASTTFAGWSMTKSVLGALVGILVGQGRLSLEDRSLLPEWQPPDPRSKISLEDLLRMRSGLKFDEVYEDLSSDIIEMLFNSGNAAAYAAAQPLIARPGSSWSYSSGTTNILSRIVRTTVGDAAYAEWPKRVLFDPAGMTSAFMEQDASGTFVGSSYMLATARDWARFGQLYLDDGIRDGQRILPEGWVRFSTRATLEAPEHIYGAHWWLGLKPELGGGTRAARHIPLDAFHAIGHEAQTLTVIPSLRLVVVRLGLSVHIDAWNHASFISDIRDALEFPDV